THMPASRAAGYLYIIPILTILLGWLLLNEIPLLLSLTGGIIALLGAIILHYSKKIG
ncbi:MAG: EamA family transporter, partial [Hydrotalea flava]|nr:EamA family transporter [Hydrotalea flava]NIT19362.1 EamA family transporter [Hydrotalea flava]